MFRFYQTKMNALAAIISATHSPFASTSMGRTNATAKRDFPEMGFPVNVSIFVIIIIQFVTQPISDGRLVGRGWAETLLKPATYITQKR